MDKQRTDTMRWRTFCAHLDTLEVRLAVHYSCNDPLFGPPHHHDELFHITHLLSGEGHVRIEGRQLRVGPGDLVWIPRGVTHESQDVAEPRFELIEIKFWMPGAAADSSLATIPPVTSIADLVDLPTALERVVEARMIETMQTGWLTRIRLAELLMLLAGVADRPRQYNGPITDTDRRVGRAIRHLSLHYADPLTVADLAAVAGMSESHFANCFRQITRKSPGEQLIQTRLHHAREFLGMTDLPVAVIAEQCGFASPQYFSRLFSQREGVPPSRFRSRHRQREIDD